MLKAQECNYKGVLGSPLEKTNKGAADERSHGNGDRSTGKFTASLGPQPPLARDAVVQIKAAALDAQSSPRNPCLSHYLHLMEWHIAAAANK